MDIRLGTLNNTQGFRILGARRAEMTGGSVSSAGDVNGDGFADVIIGNVNVVRGTSYVIFGKARGFSDIRLDTLNATQGFRILGDNTTFDRSGISVSSAGDINGDGYADVIIGAVWTQGARPGKSYVIFGKARGFMDISLGALTPTQGFRILGARTNDYSGSSVSDAGDVNGDGYADVIVGAYGATGRAGMSYVIFGKAAGFRDIRLDTLAPSQGFRILGENANDCSGSSVNGAGDVNGDGYADVIIGAYGASGSAGKSYVIFGKASGFGDLSLSTLTSSQGFRILGENANDYSGSSVSGAGDVNGDGYADVIIGAYAATSMAGKSYILLGKASGFTDISLSVLNTTQGFRIFGEHANDQSGRSVSAAGDINGDGFADVIIGAPGITNSYGAGTSYAIFGKAGGFGDIRLDTLAPSQGFRILGENANDYSGKSVSDAGDVNSDGYADVIIGAYGASGSAGKSYVIFGRNNSVLTNTIALSTSSPMSSPTQSHTISPTAPTKSISTLIGLGLDENRPIELIEYQKSDVSFDYLDNGNRTKTSWVGPKDAFLIYDYNHNKQVDAAKELVLTKWSKTATTGFEALKEVFDSNKDHKFDANDAEFDKFMIWQDKNQDGISQSNEIKSLPEAGLVRIDFDTEQTINGEFFGEEQAMQIAGVSWADGRETLVYDLALQAESLA
jgi:hypothetical protein